jgi:hypothetical protein
MEDTEDDWMLLLKDTDDSMKEGALHIISKVGTLIFSFIIQFFFGGFPFLVFPPFYVALCLGILGLLFLF